MLQTEQVRVVVSSKGVLIPIASLLSGALGATAGYFVARNKLEKKYAQRADDEIAAAKEYYERANKKGKYQTPASAVEALSVVDGDSGEEPTSVETVADVLRQYQGVEESEDRGETVIEETVINIFTENDTVDIHPDTETRSSDAPYIITQEDFFANEPEHDQQTVTYYEGDGVLADQRDIPIQDVDATVGDENLTKFGHGSNDRNLVLVRNERLEVDFEVLRSTGKFSVEVAGFTDDDNDSRGRHANHKFREDDD